MTSFAFALSKPENRAVWCRCIHSIAQVSEDIRFTYYAKRLVLSSRNVAYTGYMDITFESEFFKTYEFSTDRVAEGLHKGHNDSEDIGFTLSVKSKLLSMLFKRHEEDVEQFKVSVDATGDCPTRLQYKLCIEVLTKNLIKKTFTPFYTICSPELQRLSDYYKDNFNAQRSGKAGSRTISYIAANVGTLRRFMDNSGSSELVKFDIDAKRFSITAFTRGVSIREKEVLKQPMSVTVRFNTEDLEDYSLGGAKEEDDDSAGENSDSCEYKLVFRLKDFKNLLNLGSSGDSLESWFIQGGEMILFEIRKDYATVRLILDTDDDVTVPDPVPLVVDKQRKRRKEERIELPRVVPIIEQEQEQPQDAAAVPSITTNDLFVPEDNDDDGSTDGDNNSIEHHQDDYSRGADFTQEGEHDSGPRVTWGDPNADALTLKSLVNTRSQVIQEAKLQYLESIKRRKLELADESTSNEYQETGLGPTQVERDPATNLGLTQNSSKAKGIFD